MRKTGHVFSLIGPGRVGTSLGMALIETGWRCDSIVVGYKNYPEIRNLKRHFPGTFFSDSLSSLRPDFDLLLLTVSDNRIREVCEELAGSCTFSWREKTVLHTSGIVEVNSLEKLKAKGASTGAFHPIASFATQYSSGSAQNICYDFLGGRTAGVIAGKIARSLSSRLVRLKTERERELLHVASVIVSNFTVIGVRSAEKLVSNSIHETEAKSLLDGLLASTAANLSQGRGVASLTGPLARGDINVILRHLQLLESDPLLLQFYKSSSLLGLDLLLENERNTVRRRNLSEIRKLLEG